MMLTLTPAPSGYGLVLRDTNTRASILVEGQDLLDIGAAMLRAAGDLPPDYRPRPRGKGPRL